MMKKGKRMKIIDLTPAPYNPREIDEKRLEMLGKSMREFGDLSGIVKNVESGNLIGGHQRIKHFDPSWPISKRPHQDAVGTVAVGEIETPFGLWSYREVRWLYEKEIAANIAANRHGGEFDEPKLMDLIEEIRMVDMDLDLIGFTREQIEAIMPPSYQEESIPEETIVPVRDPNIIVRLSFHPGMWLGKREEIIQVTEKLKRTYNCIVKIEE